VFAFISSFLCCCFFRERGGVSIAEGKRRRKKKKKKKQKQKHKEKQRSESNHIAWTKETRRQAWFDEL